MVSNIIQLLFLQVILLFYSIAQIKSGDPKDPRFFMQLIKITSQELALLDDVCVDFLPRQKP